MNMLDATAIANPSHYTKEDIKDLYVRRFRKDVIADLSKTVKERESRDVECQASEGEERVFALLADLKLPECFAILVQPLHQRINCALFVLNSDLFDFGVGAFVAMVIVVFAVSSF